MAPNGIRDGEQVRLKEEALLRRIPPEMRKTFSGLLIASDCDADGNKCPHGKKWVSTSDGYSGIMANENDLEVAGGH
ncbi:MAG: hypothetical protein ABSA74_01215 [Candidatus Staskawiczbacteria bacterium]|jgi:hypothetical protein